MTTTHAAFAIVALALVLMLAGFPAAGAWLLLIAFLLSRA